MSGKIKRKLEAKTLIEKCNILRELEKGMTNKEASEKYNFNLEKKVRKTL